MPGIPRKVAEHSLDVRPNSKPVKQRLRRFDELKHRAIGEELQKLLASGLIKEVPFDPNCPDGKTLKISVTLDSK